MGILVTPLITEINKKLYRDRNYIYSRQVRVSRSGSILK